MAEITTMELRVGQITQFDYFTNKGELLIAKGTQITQRHLDTLFRRNILNLHYKKRNNTTEIDRILTTKFDEIDNFNSEEAADKNEPTVRSNPPPALATPELAAIPKGKDGLIQLMKSSRCKRLDTKLEQAHSNNTPSGVPLKRNLQQLKTNQRTLRHKTEIQRLYNESIRQTVSLFRTLANGQAITSSPVRSIVKQCVRNFTVDRALLLNLASTKSDNDDYLFHHSFNVCLLSIGIAASYGFNEQQIIEIGMGALLHDIGMLLLPGQIRFKTGNLTNDEWFEIQKHSILGLHLLEKVYHLPESVPFVAYQCHERENGKGYPKQRSSRFIHHFAKVIQVADMYEALSSPRCYRNAYIPYKAMEMIIKMTRQGLVAGEYVKALLEFTSLFPIGSIVELSNQMLGKVIRTNHTSFAKPIVRILYDKEGNELPNDQVYEEDLSANTSIQVVKAHAFDFDNQTLLAGF